MSKDTLWKIIGYEDQRACLLDMKKRVEELESKVVQKGERTPFGSEALESCGTAHSKNSGFGYHKMNKYHFTFHLQGVNEFTSQLEDKMFTATSGGDCLLGFKGGRVRLDFIREDVYKRQNPNRETSGRDKKEWLYNIL